MKLETKIKCIKCSKKAAGFIGTVPLCSKHFLLAGTSKRSRNLRRLQKSRKKGIHLK